MSLPVLLLLLTLAAAALYRLLSETRPRARPAFRAHNLFAGQLTEGLVHALIADRTFLRSDTRVSGAWGSTLRIDRDGACGRLVLAPALAFGTQGDLPMLRALAARHAGERSTTIVVIGGSAAFGREALAATAPVRAMHIDDEGAVREARASFRSTAPRLVIDSALDRMAKDLAEGAFPIVDFATARRLAGSDAELDAESGFGSRAAVAIPRGVVTPALTVAILACFAVEVAISRDALAGNGASLSVAYRMGAIHQPSILGGEWQRLIAAPFLHFGFLHLGMNAWAQWSLGLPLEFLVGPWGFLALWVVSALGASLTSLAFNDVAVAAGASGAVFGLLGAFTTFIFFRRDVLPQPVPRPLRNGVLATLLLNLLISFVPGIDTAAHAGGFLTGAVFAFALARSPRSLAPARPLALRLVVALMLAVGVGLTSVQNRADATVGVPAIVSDHRIDALHLPIPEGFTVSESRSRGLTVVAMDGSPGSPYSVTYRVSPVQPDEPSAQRVLETLRSKAADGAPSDWIALARLGIQDRRAIELVVTAPASRRAEAEELGARLARAIR